MGLITKTSQSYYNKSQGFIGNGSTGNFTLTTAAFSTIPSSVSVFVSGKEINTSNYTYSSPTVNFTGNVSNADVLETGGAPKSGLLIEIKPAGVANKFGDYRYISLADTINNYMVAFVGDGKLIGSVKKQDILFHAKRGIQEFDATGSLLTGTPVTSNNFSQFDNRKISGNFADEDVTYDTNIGLQKITAEGGRRGMNPETSQENGVFIIDELNGKISFSSELAGKIVTIKYVSDGLGTDDEMKIHKFAEDAIYKYITYGVASSRVNFPEYIVNRFRKEKRAAIRNAKLRLSSLKISELEQVMRGKSKFIKH